VKRIRVKEHRVAWLNHARDNLQPSADHGLYSLGVGVGLAARTHVVQPTEEMAAAEDSQAPIALGAAVNRDRARDQLWR